MKAAFQSQYKSQVYLCANINTKKYSVKYQHVFCSFVAVPTIHHPRHQPQAQAQLAAVENGH